MISKEIIYFSTIYLYVPSLKLLGQSVLVISCTRCGRPTWPLTLTFDLRTWISTGIIYSSRTIYLPSLKLLGQIVLELSVAPGVGNQHDLWPEYYRARNLHLQTRIFASRNSVLRVENIGTRKKLRVQYFEIKGSRKIQNRIKHLGTQTCCHTM